MLFFVAATMFSFASCNKDDTDDNPSGGGGGSSANYPETLEQTVWEWEGNADANDVVRVGIAFAQYANNCTVTLMRSDYSSLIYRGNYTQLSTGKKRTMSQASTTMEHATTGANF